MASNGIGISVATIKQQAMQNKVIGGTPVNEPGEQSELLSREAVGLNPMGDLIATRATSWLGEPGDLECLDREVSRMNHVLNNTGGFARIVPPGQREAVPVYANPFKCDFCNDVFNHLTPDYIPMDEASKVTCYREHLKDKHLPELHNKYRTDYRKQAAPEAPEVATLRAEVATLKSVMGDMLGKMEASKAK